MELFTASAIHAPALLSDTEAAQLANLEATIERGLQTFVEVGTSLALIRDSRLYRQSFGTFEDYCQQRWGMDRTYAHRTIEAARAVSNVLPIGNKPPANEAQARPLTRLAPEEQPVAWQRAVETAPEGKVTAAHVERVVKEMKEMKGEAEPEPAPLPPNAPVSAQLSRESYTVDADAPAEDPAGEPAPRPEPSKMDVHYSSESKEWYTPADFLAVVAEALGGIDLDPCSNPERTVPAARHFTAEEDGLAREWAGQVFMNPPYGDEISQWVEKLVAEYEAGRVTEAIALVPARTDTRWFNAFRPYARCFVRGRIRFEGPAATGNSASFPSAAVFLTREPERFARAFADVGDTYARVEVS